MARGVSSRAPRSSPLLAPVFRMMTWMLPIRPVQATRIIQPGDELPILGGLRVLATPGHTPGHLSFFAPAHGVLFAGDSMMVTRRQLRFIDGPFTWDYRVGCESVQQQARLNPRIICCGHGPVVRDKQISFPQL